MSIINYALEQLLDAIISTNPMAIREYVDKLRVQNPGISNDRLAKMIIDRKSFKNGLIGAVTGIGSILTLPVSIPADIIASWRIQAIMAFSIAYVYGHTANTTDLKTDLYLIMAGDSAKEVLKRLSITASKEVTRRAVQKYITKDIMKQVWKYVGQKIISKAGEKSLVSFMKMVPLIGMPVGFIFDWIAARTVGYTAIKYYR